MKKFSSLLLLILCTSVAFAQFNLTQAHMPGDGDSQYYQMMDTTGFSLGAMGTGQTWDFSSAADSTEDFMLDFTLPSATPNGATFSTSDLASYDNNFEYRYYSVSATDWILDGTSDDLALNNPAKYNPTATLLTFPMAFNTTVYDTFASTFMASGFNAYRSGTISTVVDAEGNITLPNGMTYNGVIRVHEEKIWQDSSNILGQNIINNFTVNRYSWYDSTMSLPVFGYIHRDISFATNSSKELYLFYADTTGSVSIDEEESGLTDIRLFPNPATDEFTLAFRNADHANVMIEAFDLFGKRVYSEDLGTINSGMRHHRIDASQLESGVYFIKVSSELGSVVRKVVLQ